MQKSVIKKCPFCGGEAKILHGGLAFMASVQCTECGAEIKRIAEQQYQDPVAMAVVAWNRRPRRGRK